MAQAVPQLRALTSLRFVAAMGVVLFHTTPWQASSAVWARVAGLGFAAVGFFFVLSGFILMHNYRARDLRRERRTFYVARFARIYPAYVLALALSLPFVAQGLLRHGRDPGQTLLELGLAVTLVQAWWPAHWHAINPPGWSLSVEVFFYLVFPLLVGPVAALSRRRTVLALAAVYGGALVALFVYRTLGIHPADVSDDRVAANFVRYAPPLHLFELGFGMLLANLGTADAARARAVVTLQGAALALVCGVALSSDLLPYDFMHNAGLMPLYGLVIWSFAHDTQLTRLVSTPLLLALGEASYSLYILHLVLWVCFGEVAERFGLDASRSAVVWGVYAVGVCGASWLAFRYVETPLRKRLIARLARPEVTLAPSAQRAG